MTMPTVYFPSRPEFDVIDVRFLTTDGGEKLLLPLLNRLDHGGGLPGPVRAHGGMVRVSAHAEWHDILPF